MPNSVSLESHGPVVCRARNTVAFPMAINALDRILFSSDVGMPPDSYTEHNKRSTHMIRPKHRFMAAAALALFGATLANAQDSGRTDRTDANRQVMRATHIVRMKVQTLNGERPGV